MNDRILLANWVGVAAFVVTHLPVFFGAGGGVLASGAAVAVVLFVASIPVAVYGMARAATRITRDGDRITLTGLFLLRGSAPASVRRNLAAAFALTLAVTVASATSEPFSILVPIWPLAWACAWGARNGVFFTLEG